MLRNSVTASLLATSALLVGSIETAEAQQQNQVTVRRPASTARAQPGQNQAQAQTANRSTAGRTQTASRHRISGGTNAKAFTKPFGTTLSSGSGKGPGKAFGKNHFGKGSFGKNHFGKGPFGKNHFGKGPFGKNHFGNHGWAGQWNGSHGNGNASHLNGKPWNYQQWSSQWGQHLPTPVIHTPVVCQPPPHVHAFDIVFEQEWVEPVFQTVTVGYQSCGTPILQEVIVQAGFFRTAKYELCGCGEKVFIGYV